MRYLLLAFSLLISLEHFSQNKIVVGGKVQIEDVKCEEDFMPKSILLEMNYENKWVVVNKFSIEKCENYFKFSRFIGNFRMTVEATGYNSTISEFEINNETNDTLFIKDIMLTKLANQLDEVVLIGNSSKKEFIKVEANKTTVQISNNDFFLNGSVNEAITKLPGIIPGPNGTVMLNGKSVLVWVDGQSTGLTGDDLVNFLNSLPANLVEKVEIISNPDASFDANTSNGVLNIITSNKSFKGISGTITSNFYRSDYNNFSNSISLNGKVKNLSWQTSFGNNHAKKDYLKTLNLGFLNFNPAQNLSQEYNTFSENNNYFFRSSLQYSINEDIKIGFKYGFNTVDNDQNSTGYVWNESNELSNSKGSPASKNTLNDITLNYTHIIDKWGRKLNIISNYTNYNKNQNTALTQFYNNINQDKTYSISGFNSKIDNFNIKIDFDIPFDKKNLSLKFGTKWSNNRYNSLGKYNLNSTDSSILDHNSYNDEITYFNNESIFAIYTELGKKINKWNFSTGLRWENYKSESVFQNENKINDFFPSAAILYKFGNNIDYKINYARKIDRPGYSDLDPNISDLLDAYTSIQGNPYLKPNIIHRFETGLSFMKYVSIGFNYSLSNSENFIVFENLGNYQTIQKMNTFKNVGYYNYNISLPIPFGVFKEGMNFFNNPKKLDINKMNFIYFNAGIGQTLLENADDYFKDNKPFKQFMAFTQIILPFETKLHLNYFLAKGTYQIYYLNHPIQALNITLTKSFLKDQFKVSLYANDIFNTHKTNVLAQSENLNITYFTKESSQYFGAKLSYNFGKYSALHKQQEIEDNNDKERLEDKKEIKM